MMEFSEQMKRAINRLRRRIHDMDQENLRFTDDDLYGYISDAVDELEMGRYAKGVAVDEGDFVRRADGRPVVITIDDMVIYTIKAQILLKLSLKDIADRDNFSLRKNNLSVDTTKQSSDHKETLEILEKHLDQYIYRSRKIVGVRVE